MDPPFLTAAIIFPVSGRRPASPRENTGKPRRWPRQRGDLAKGSGPRGAGCRGTPSPLPRTGAVPPVKQKGTSADVRSDLCQSRRGKVQTPPTVQTARTAAASALPAAEAGPGGDPFLKKISTPRSLRALPANGNRPNNPYYSRPPPGQGRRRSRKPSPPVGRPTHRRG